MATQIPDASPTPMPWESEELSVRQSLHALGSHVMARLDRQDEAANERSDIMRRGLKMDLDSFKDDVLAEVASVRTTIVSLGRAVEQLAKREEVTGSYMINVAAMAGEAKGLASRSRRESDPVRRIAVDVFTLTVKHFPVWGWRLLPFVTAAVMYLLHRAGALGK